MKGCACSCCFNNLYEQKDRKGWAFYVCYLSSLTQDIEGCACSAFVFFLFWKHRQGSAYPAFLMIWIPSSFDWRGWLQLLQSELGGIQIVKKAKTEQAFLSFKYKSLTKNTAFSFNANHEKANTCRLFPYVFITNYCPSNTKQTLFMCLLLIESGLGP